LTSAQKDYLAARGIDPWSLRWADAQDVGYPAFGLSEAAVLPSGEVLLANGLAMPHDHGGPHE
jgi:hypothetical protein